MTSKEFMEWLDNIGAEYSYTDNDGRLEQVYVYEKDARLKKKLHPKKYKDLFVSYLRVSNFDGDLYTRYNGICGNMSEERIKNICIDLTEQES